MERSLRATAAVSRALSAADLFRMLWWTLSDMIGTAACATLLSRSCARARVREPSLDELEISRVDLEYRYRLPLAWHEASSSGVVALRALCAQLRVLLGETTGAVVLRRLDELEGFREHGIVFLRGTS